MANTIGFYEIGKKKKTASWVYKLILFISFVWLSLYSAISTSFNSFFFSFGNAFDLGSTTFSTIAVSILIESLLSWAIFEILLWIYRTILSFKIYSFIVPADDLKKECRMFFAIRNVLLGIFVNLSFFFPYLYELLNFVDLILIVGLLIVFAVNIQRKYSEPIISHFVFKCFCLPVFVYECLILLFAVMGVMV